MINYLLACLFLFVSHAVPSAPGVRPWLMTKLGRPLFVSLYSALSLGAVIWFIFAYAGFEGAGAVFSPSPIVIQVAILLMPVAFFFMIGRLLAPFGESDAPLKPRGIYRICRFPGSTGILLWAFIHIVATGDVKRIIAFGTFALIALYAMAKNEWVLRRSESSEAEAYLNQTHLIPFLGRGGLEKGERTRLWPEIGWRVPVISLGLFGLLLFLHPLILSVDPLSWFG